MTTKHQHDQDLEQLRREALEFFEERVSSIIEQMPKLAEALSVVRTKELYRLAGHSDFYEYVRCRFAVPPHLAVLVEECFGETVDSLIEK